MKRALGPLFALALACIPARAAAQDTFLIVVTGVSGEDALAAQYQKWGATVVDGAKKRGVPAGNIFYLGEAPDKDPARIKARSTRENVTQAFTDVTSRAKPSDEVFVLLIGHGAFDGQMASFNLPGPDLTAADYAKLVQKLGLQRVTFVNTTASSGAFIAPLKGVNHVIVAATKTGGERLDTKFPGYFVDALDSEEADRDKNGRVSVQEAFDYAKTKVTAEYEKGGHILTEHATLDDSTDGKLAGATYLSPERMRDAATTAAAAADPALKALLTQQDALERQVAELRLKKETMDPAQDDQQLEKLLTDLALKTKEIRDREKK